MKKEKAIKSPLDFFFGLGDKITKGDPRRQADFTYYMIWILFIAFASMFVKNLYSFLRTFDFSFLIWAAIGFAIMSLQFFSLKSLYQIRKLRNEPKKEPEEKIENVDEMLRSFKK